MLRLKCAEVWGGIRDGELDVCSRGLTVSLFSSACDGGKGGDVYFCSVCRGDRVPRVAVADVVGHGVVWVDLPQAPGDGRRNLPLGIDRNCPYRTTGVTAAFGDVLLPYTDGASEAPSPDGVLFGPDRLRALLSENASASPCELKSRLLTSLRNQTGGRLDHDDVTFLAIEVA